MENSHHTHMHDVDLVMFDLHCMKLKRRILRYSHVNMQDQNKRKLQTYSVISGNTAMYSLVLVCCEYGDIFQPNIHTWNISISRSPSVSVRKFLLFGPEFQ